MNKTALDSPTSSQPSDPKPEPSFTLVFDTETTGKADFRAGPEYQHQPRIVQLAALLMDREREVMSLNVIIRPDGWTIPDEAAQLHGITTEYAELVGVPIKTALNMFGRMRRAATRYVAHNIDFDRLLVLSESFKTFGQLLDLPDHSCFCTMKAMTGYCKLPGIYNDYKWPKLIEAYRHAFGEEFDGAHDALADVRACSRVFQWIESKRTQPIHA